MREIKPHYLFLGKKFRLCHYYSAAKFPPPLTGLRLFITIFHNGISVIQVGILWDDKELPFPPKVYYYLVIYKEVNHVENILSVYIGYIWAAIFHLYDFRITKMRKIYPNRQMLRKLATIFQQREGLKRK